MPITLETSETNPATDLKEIAIDVVSRAVKGGATAAECVVREGDEFSTVVRLGQVETLKESGSRAIGVRVFFGQRAASTYSSDFSAAGIERMLKSALELAKICSEDPNAGIPEAGKLGSLSGNLHLYHEDVYSLPGPERIEYARRAEKAAKASEAAAAKSLAVVRKQLEYGQISTIALLNAQQTYMQAMLALVQEKAGRYSDTAALFQALGGGWWNRPPPAGETW